MSGTGRILVDTNVVIAHENDSHHEDVHATAAASMMALARGLDFSVVVSHGTAEDFTRAPSELARHRRKLLDKYYAVMKPVPPNQNVRQQFPDAMSDNDRSDLEVLSAYATGYAAALVTEDTRMLTRARRAGLQNVLTIAQARTWLGELKNPALHNAAAARWTDAYAVKIDAPIFDSLRADYPGFVDWWRSKVVPERRPVILLGDNPDPEGVAVLKDEPGAFELPAPTMKLCTFKVVEDESASRRGELLFRAVMDHARGRQAAALYVTVLPDKERLLNWLPKFGFSRLNPPSDTDETILVKHLRPPTGIAPLSPLDHAQAYGPGSIRIERAHVVPIRREFHRILFPDGEDMQSLFDNEPCGNAIRKAYLCNAPTRKVARGDALIFMRTGCPGVESAATAVGVVEAITRSEDPAAIAAAVRGRTVYSLAAIKDLTARGEVLVIRFRLDRHLDPTWPRADLVGHGVVRATPQSIAEVTTEEGLTWIRHQLDALP